MTFNPSSTIYLCSVDFDNSYKHQVYFENGDGGGLARQQNYFNAKMKLPLNNYLTVREKLPNGSTRSTINVDANIDYLRSLPVNYMFYQNANHGTKWFYAFITDLIYVSEGTTKIIFETDVFQTWMFDITIHPSYVVREHSELDIVGDNLVPESFNFQDYHYENASAILTSGLYTLDQLGYLVGTSVHVGGETTVGCLYSGIYQGNAFYYFEKIANLNKFIDEITTDGEDAILFITVIPRFCLEKNSILALDGKEWSNATEGYVGSSDSPAKDTYTISFNADTFLMNGYQPKNKKLLTNPFLNLVVTNQGGSEAVYNIEDFSVNGDMEQKSIKFNLYGDVSATPSLTLIPLDYKHTTENFDFGISIGGFPQCSFNIDSYKLWLAKNTGSMALHVGEIVGGLALSATGAGAMAGGMGVLSGVTGILSTFNDMYKASKEPNKYNAGAPKNNLLTATKKNLFTYYWRYLKKDYLKTIDDFFTMYGYQTNRLKQPNLSSRPFFNYVQTVDINITGGIPSDDMQRLKAVFNNGVTLWKPHATICKYNVANNA